MTVTTVPDFTLHPMTDDTAARCRALVPAAFPAIGRPADCIIAQCDGEVIGAGAMAWVPDGFPVLVGVVSQARRRGVARALIGALRERAVGETPGLKGWAPVAEDSDTAHLLRAAGFAVHQRLHVFQAEPTTFGNAMTALFARLHSRVPAGATLTSPADVPADTLGSLLADQFSLRADLLNTSLRDGAGGWDNELSQVLVVDGEIGGAILARRIATGVEVDFNVVLPRWRGGWANVMLIETLVRRVRAAGLPLVRFLAEPHVHDTANLSRRAGGVRLADQVTFVQPF